MTKTAKKSIVEMLRERESAAIQQDHGAKGAAADVYRRAVLAEVDGGKGPSADEVAGALQTMGISLAVLTETVSDFVTLRQLEAQPTEEQAKQLMAEAGDEMYELMTKAAEIESQQARLVINAQSKYRMLEERVATARKGEQRIAGLRAKLMLHGFGFDSTNKGARKG